MTSKSLRSASQLEYNVPGCILSVKIPSAEVSKLHSEKLMVEINCKSFFSKLVKTADAARSDVNGVPAVTTIADLPSEPKFTKIANRYDNIIDQLERKYYCESMLQSKDDDSDQSDSSESIDMNGGGDNGATSALPAGTSSKSNKRKKVFADDYDVDDPFIDDEEMIYEVEAAMKTNRTKTKHDGFFVSSGKLEVMSPKKMQKVSTANKLPKDVAKSASTKPSVAPAAGEAPDASKVEQGENEEKGDAVKKRKRRTKKEIEEAIARGDIKPKFRPPSDAPVITSLDGTAISTAAVTTGTQVVVESATEGGTPVGTAPEVSSPVATTAKPKVEKTEWQPNDAVLSAMLEFQTYYEHCGLKLCKSSNLPKSLEEPLRAVDTKVVAHINPEALARTSGYYEGLQSIMGGEVNIGKIRSLLTRLRLRERAETTRLVIEAQVTTLMVELKANVAPCPEKLQPAAKAAKKAQHAANQQTALQQPADGTGGTGTVEPAVQEDGSAHNGEDPAASAMDCESPGAVLSAPIAAPALVIHMESPSGGPSQGDEAPNAVSGAVPRADISAAPNTSSANASASAINAIPNAASSTGSAAVAAVRYDWVCNWDRPMKVTLCQIEHNLKVWVVQENLYREKLTVHDKKYLSDSEAAMLVEKDVITEYFTRICSELPASCLQGNVAYMRRVVTMLKVPGMTKEKDTQKDKEKGKSASSGGQSGQSKASLGAGNKAAETVTVAIDCAADES